jgi:hypothetical protein
MTANTFSSTNNKISNLVNSQVPFFVRNDHQNFVKFIEAYYEWLEQADGSVSGIANNQQYNVTTRAKNISSFYDIDRTINQFSEHLYSHFMKLIPANVQVDKALLLKNIKDFYRARGTEKATSLLLNIIFGEDKQIEFYYPKRDVLRASDGKWFIEKSIKVSDWQVDGIPNTNPSVLNYFANTIITGNTSGANAVVERVESYFEAGLPVKEIKISSQKGNFENGETLFTTFVENNVTKSLTATVFGGAIASTNIIAGGNAYSVGTEVPIVSNTGSNGRIIISSVTSGNIGSIVIVRPGAGFLANDGILISGGGGGSGANAQISSVITDGTVHPNSYNIIISLISDEANTPIGNSIFANLSSSNANTTLVNALASFVYSNTGPVNTVSIFSTGSGYTSLPTLDALANTRVRSLGILGRMEIINGGVGYEANDKINFINVLGGYGSGALGNVAAVNTTGSITQVEFIPVPGHITGGTGYTQSLLPLANVVSSNVNAYGANIAVTAILGDGEQLAATTTSIGRILGLTIESAGSNYDANTTLDLTNLGDGTAQVSVTIVQGVYTYPGRWLNDDGHVSSYNFLQDRDYYQNFSYVVKINESIDKYKKALLELTHPIGMKLFGEYTFEDTSYNGVNVRARFSESETIKFVKSTYKANLGNIVINTANNNLSVNDTIYLEFVSGDTINITNGIFIVDTANTDYFSITHPANTTNSSGNVYAGLII